MKRQSLPGEEELRVDIIKNKRLRQPDLFYFVMFYKHAAPLLIKPALVLASGNLAYCTRPINFYTPTAVSES
jgi:hypothetical protein